MKNSLPNKVRLNECGILNLDNKEGPGTHWTAYKKTRNEVIYFDSYGDLRPPLELIKYLQSNGFCNIVYNYESLQTFNSINCGHLCLRFLYNCYK
nr:hypothetical protein [Enterobacter cloacae complex sp. 2DZ2F20B]